MCYQYGDALKEPGWIHEFCEADVTEMREIHGEAMTVEEYRTRLVRSFAKAPSTPKSKQAWVAFKPQHAQLVRTVTRAKTAVSKKNKEADKKGAREPAQKPPQGTVS